MWSWWRSLARRVLGMNAVLLAERFKSFLFRCHNDILSCLAYSDEAILIRLVRAACVMGADFIAFIVAS